MTTKTALIFQGVSSPPLLLTILLAISLVLLGWGAWQIVRGRRRYGAVCVGAALGPLVGGPLAVAALVIRRGRLAGKSEAAAWALAGLAAAALVALAFSAAVDGLGPGAWMTLLGAQVFLTVGLFYAAVYAYLGTPRVVALMALRAAAVIALLLVLFKPAISRTTGPGDPDAAKPVVPVLVDRSASMATRDVGDPWHGPRPGQRPTRYGYALWKVEPALGDLRRDFRVAWYHFADAAQPADALSALKGFTPSGEDAWQTRTADALRTVSQNHMRSEMAAVVVVSDGADNPTDPDPRSERLLSAARRLGVPVYTVGVGSLRGPKSDLGRNVRVADVTVSPAAVIKNNVANVSVRLDVSGLARTPVKVRLFEEGQDRQVDARDVWTHKDSAELKVDLKWTPRDPDAPADAEQTPSSDADIRTLRVEAAAVPGETLEKDNAASLHVLVTQPRIRVLYVEGSIRPEYQQLKRLLDTDPNVQFMGLVRVADERFWAYGRIDGRKLSALPARPADFELFDVLILGDLDRRFLSAGQMRLIRRFVNDGGGLLMLGGHSSFGPGGYGGTDVEEALPVICGGRSQPQEKTPFLPQVTAAGEAHPVLEGIAGYFPGPGGRKPKEDLPSPPHLEGCVAVERAKPAADVLAVHPTRRNEAGPLVLLATQRFGVGRGAAMTGDTTWKWFKLLRARGERGPYERFWAQLVRWLAGVKSKGREAATSVVAQLAPSRSVFSVGEEIRIIAAVRGGNVASGETKAECRVLPPGDAEAMPLTMRPAGRMGYSEALFPVREPGDYCVEVSAVEQGKAVASDRFSMHVLTPPSDERRAETEPARLKLNRELLERIARETDGRYRPVDDVRAAFEDIRRDRKAVAETAAQGPRTDLYPLYNFTILFLLFVALLTAEWLLRRNWQLH